MTQSKLNCSMAFCAPRQLSAFLPVVVPQLTGVLADAHHRVQLAARQALEEIGSVVRNPEIQTLVPELLNALADPSGHTKSALKSLLDTSFVNSVDPPSLALIIPILTRGLRDRAPTTKTMAAQIIGNICSFLRDVKDVLPYTSAMVDDLKTVLLDPIPDVRTAAARALGLLFRGVGEKHFDGLLSWLLDLLKSDTSGVERNGAAQGLGEVLAALGPERLDQHLPELLKQLVSNPYVVQSSMLLYCSPQCFNHVLIIQRHHEPTVREGFLGLWVYLPRAFGPRLEPHIPAVLPSIVSSLADDKEAVRSMALKAGQALIEPFALTSYKVLLTTLRDALSDLNWRVRELSSLLTGDVLNCIAGGRVCIVSGDHIEFDVDDFHKLENEISKPKTAIELHHRNQLHSIPLIELCRG